MNIVPAKALLLFALTALAATPAEPVPGMVRVEGGELISFFETSGERTIEVVSFLMDEYAVTNEQFASFVKEYPQWSKAKIAKLFADGGYLKHWTPEQDFETIKKSPVTNVSWHAANAYCKCQGKRLPTMAEWEYAAGAGIENDKRPLSKVILEWYSKPTPPYVPAVGSGFKNNFGLHDMHGLIWEWVSDFNSIVMDSDSRSNSSLKRDLYCASGSFGAADQEDYATFMRFAFRSSLQSKYTVGNLGFRCAMDVEQGSEMPAND